MEGNRKEQNNENKKFFWERKIYTLWVQLVIWEGSFEKKYGEVGKNLIKVRHIKTINRGR